MEFRPMSPDEIERTVQFLLTQQAQFAADMATLEVGVTALSAKTDRIADGLLGLTAIVGRVTDSVGQLAEAQARTDRQLKETAAQLKETDERLGEHIKTVESHLDVVIEMFERRLQKEDDPGPS